MTKEQAQKVLDELQEVRTEKLNGEAKRLFEAIMQIADERDSLKIKIEKQEELIEYLRRSCERKDESIISMRDEDAELASKVEHQDKIIDLMADEIANNITNTCPLEDYDYYLDCANKCNDNYKECWKQYFENKAKEVK